MESSENSTSILISDNESIASSSQGFQLSGLKIPTGLFMDLNVRNFQQSTEFITKVYVLHNSSYIDVAITYVIIITILSSTINIGEQPRLTIKY